MDSMASARHVSAPSSCSSSKALQAQIRSAEASGSFAFVHRHLDTATAAGLSTYLREDCRAKFVDLSNLGSFREASLALAAALRHGMRATRSLVLDGNDLGSDPGALEAWCVALAEHPGLQHVSLRDVGLTTDGAERLARMLVWHSVLFSVDLSYNRIADPGIAVLVSAAEENRILLELNLEGMCASRGLLARLATLLERNATRFGKSGSALGSLRDLRRVRAQAQSAMAMTNRIGVTVGLKDVVLPHTPCVRRDRLLRALRGEEEVPLPDADAEPEPQGSPQGQEFHDARGQGEATGRGHEVLAELLRRSEAEWRHGPVQREQFSELRRRIADLKAERDLEKSRCEETLQRVAASKTERRHHEVPPEQATYRLKERLATQVEETKVVLRETIAQKTELGRAKEDLEQVLNELRVYKLGATSLEHSLKLRHREVMDGVSAAQKELHGAEESVGALEAENERLRRLLRAHHFETETERFLPRAAKIVASGVR